MVTRLTRGIVPLASGLVALVLSHSIVYLVRYGSAYGEALAHDGHGSAWTIAVWSIAVLGGALAVAGLARLASLARDLAAGGQTLPAVEAARALSLRSWLAGATRLTVVTAVVLTVQENAEHLAAGLDMPGPFLLLRAEYPFALAIVVAVSLAITLVVHLYRRRRDELLARLRRPRATFVSPSVQPRCATSVLEPPASILGRIGGLRAPPVLLAG